MESADKENSADLPQLDFDPYDPKLMEEILKYNVKKEQGPPPDVKKPGQKQRPIPKCDNPIDIDSMNKLFQYCHQIPKIELHAHIGGSYRPTTFLELSDAKGIDTDHIDFYNVDIKTAFEIFKVGDQLITDTATLKRVTKEIIEDYAKQNTRYLELRSTPKIIGKISSKIEYIDTICEAIKESSLTNPKIKVKYLISVNRTRPETAKEAVDLLLYYKQNLKEAPEATGYKVGDKVKIKDLKNQHHYNGMIGSIVEDKNEESQRYTIEIFDGKQMKIKDSNFVKVEDEIAAISAEPSVVGIELSGDPRSGDFTKFVEEFKRAQNEGFKITLHCGETKEQIDENQQMIDFGPDRLGHCCYLTPDQIKQVVDKNIPVEICPSSNVAATQCGLPQFLPHLKEFKKYSEANLIICCDDTFLFNTNLSMELFEYTKAMGITENEQIKSQLIKNVEAIFMDDLSYKEKLKDEIFNKY